MLIAIIISVLVLIISVVVHEYSHAKAADHLGDPTAKLNGRLTLNPLAHIDILGSIILPLFLIITQAGIIFGWAKPVPIDYYNFRNPRKDSALVSLAGPGSNLSLAIICSILLNLFILFKLSFLITIGSLILIPLIKINIILGVFNLLPIHPLDGFKIVEGILPADKTQEWKGLEKYGFIFILLLLVPIGNSSLLNTIIGPVINFLFRLLLPQIGLGVI
ncbi:MAG: site-2 protease family protein [Candidatus Roizmanbacteria bacterium]|nr:MAG: site-2 protease family protein [Candidatus Roizmanbacteria bacterium]